MPDTEPTAREAYLIANRDYWRARAQLLHRLLVDQAAAAQRALNAEPIAPQPPIGTELWLADQIIWIRRLDGWHCARPIDSCPNCPCTWEEVWDTGVRNVPEIRTVLPA